MLAVRVEMVQELLPLLPQEPGRIALMVAIVGTLIGLGLWLAGARFSRPLLTLLAVSVGGVMGQRIPGITGWTVNSAAAAVGGAFILGLSAYLIHRLWVAILLGVVLAAWAALGTWVICNDGAQWAWPAVDAETTWRTFAEAAWTSLPDAVRKYLPYATGLALVSGFASTLLWPRIGQVLLYSTSGVSLLIGMGIAAIEFARPQWIWIIPAQTHAQLMLLFGMVAFGAVVQWQLKPPLPKDSSGGAGAKRE